MELIHRFSDQYAACLMLLAALVWALMVTIKVSMLTRETGRLYSDVRRLEIDVEAIKKRGRIWP